MINNNMKSSTMHYLRRASLVAMLILCVQGSFSQESAARKVLDKAAASLGGGGITASFSVNTFNGTALQGGTSGSISIKGSKFHASTPQAIVWFDGKTEWTYMKNNDEVNVSTPTAAQLQQMNPYHFINIYKQGYSMKLIKTKLRNTPVYEVHLKAQSKSQELQQVLISVDKNSYQPLCVRMLRDKNKWTMLSISKFSKS